MGRRPESRRLPERKRPRGKNVLGRAIQAGSRSIVEGSYGKEG